MAGHAAAAEQPVAAFHDLVVVNCRRVPRVVMAPLAEERQLRYQHAIVVRTVGIVTGRTTFTADARVLEQERSALLGVARSARFVHAVAGLQQSDVGRPVRVVARRAFHLAFAHWHMTRAIQLGDLVAMAGHALLLLRGGLQLSHWRFRMMNAVARHA